MQVKSNTLKTTLSVWIMAVVIFVITIGVGQILVSALGNNIAIVLRALLLSALFGLIVFLASRREGISRESLGIQRASKNIYYFLLGSSLLVIPLGITILLSSLVGWASFSFNYDTAIVQTQILSMLTVLLFESFPEELIFRGYILGKLDASMNKWKSGALTTLLFVLFPVVVIPIQSFILGLPTNIGGNSELTGGYLMYMTLFGAFTVWLRRLTGNLWTTIGFHVFFVSMNNLLGLTDNSLILITDYSNEGPIQITLIASILLILGTTILVSKRKKNLPQTV